MNIKGAGSFSKLVNDFAKEVPELAVQVTNKACIDLFSKVVMDTPVDTGRARGNWQISIGNAVGSELNTEDKDGSSTIGKATSELLGDKTTAPIFIQNNLPYIKKLEYGYSKKSPRGMLRKNLTLMNRFLSQAVAELKGGK